MPIYTSSMPRWSHLITLSALVSIASIASIVVSGCQGQGKDDDEDPREHRKRRINAGAVGSGNSGGVDHSCPFGLCSGGLGSGGGPEHMCQRMSEIMSKGLTAMDAAVTTLTVERCTEEMEKLRVDRPTQYVFMEHCIETSSDMNALLTCMMKAYPDGGVP